MFKLLVKLTLIFILLQRGDGTSRSPVDPALLEMTVINYAGSTIRLYWIPNSVIHSDSDANDYNSFCHKESNILQVMLNGSTAVFNSYYNQKFVVCLIPTNVSKGAFTKSGWSETVTIRNSGGNITFEQETDVEASLKVLKSSLNKCSDSDARKECSSEILLDHLASLRRDMKEQTHDWTTLGDKLFNYECADQNLETTAAIPGAPQEEVDVRALDGSEDTVHADVLLNLPHAKIWFVNQSFVTEEECGYLIDYAKKRLQKASVYDTGKQDTSRQAKQSTYIFSDAVRMKYYGTHQDYSADAQRHLDSVIDYNQLTQELSEEEKLYSLYHRILQVASVQTGMQLSPLGQEDMSIIRYHSGDRYTPHCDGSCDGSPYKPKSRVATALLYCKDPEGGGRTVFSRSSVIVTPSKGSAVFFSYMDVAKGERDYGYTNHGGCPVTAGEKWVVTAWMRRSAVRDSDGNKGGGSIADGVSLSTPWSFYDALGLRIER